MEHDVEITDEQLDEAAASWQAHGWALVPGLVSADEAASALAELRRNEPERPSYGMVTPRSFEPATSTGPAFRAEQFSGTHLFPFDDAATLNGLFVHHRMIAFARRALGTADIRLYQARVLAKFGGRVNYEQPMHRDLNHSLVPTRSDPGWWHLETFLYLTDVDEGNGAIGLVPRPNDPAVDPQANQPVDRADWPHLYAEEIRVPAPAGSLLAYRSDVWHRGHELDAGTERHAVVAAYRPAGLEWIGFDAIAPLATHPRFKAFVAGCTPDQLSVVGIPPPGHPYWTPAQVEAMTELYPGLDVGPWRDACSV